MVGSARRICSSLPTEIVLIPAVLIGCGPSAEELAAVEYRPLSEGDWKVSTPEEQGMAPMLLARLYHEAAELETLYGLMVVKNGHLIAEKYFNEGPSTRSREGSRRPRVSHRRSSGSRWTTAAIGAWTRR